MSNSFRLSPGRQSIMKFSRKQKCSPKSKNKPGLKILYWNAGGLTQDKFTELKNIISHEEPDVVSIAESGASADHLDLFPLSDYNSYALGRSRQIASGIVIFVANTLTTETKIKHTMTSQDKLEAIELRVWKQKIGFRLNFVYNPPKNIPNLQCLIQDWNPRSLIIGDFNAHSTRWGYSHTCQVGREVEDFIDTNIVEFIENSEGSPTFLSYGGHKSHPDLLLVHSNLVPFIKHDLVSSPGGAGHKILSTEIFDPDLSHESRAPRWNLKRANWPKYASLTDTFLGNFNLDGNNDKDLDHIMITILECAKHCIPRGHQRRAKPFWNDNLQALKVTRDQARQKAEETGLLQDCIELRKANASLKKEILISKRASFHSFLEHMDYRRDGPKVYKFLSSLTAKNFKSRKHPIRLPNRILVSDNDIARAFCKHYRNICNFKPKRRLTARDIAPSEVNLEWEELFSSPFSRREFNRALRKLSRGKCAGPDGILPEFILELGPAAKLTILRYINRTWGGVFPSMWRKAEVLPLLKPQKDPSDLGNYRPISMTCVLSKLTEKMIVDRLQFYLDRRNLISDRQAGFRKGYTTTEQLVRLTQHIKDGFNDKQSTLAVFIDFRTAFDKIWRKMLLRKLSSMKVSGSLFKWIRDFLGQRFLRVKYGNAKSGFGQTCQGLPQGSVLSPCLFNIMINDLIHFLSETSPEIQTLLYADDLVIWSTGNDVALLTKLLNAALVQLSKWVSDNEFDVNPNKTCFELFTLSTKSYDIELNYNGCNLTRTEKAIYLGIILDPKLTWSAQVSQVVDRSLGRLTLLKRLAGVKWGAPQDVLSCTYSSYIRPILEYGSELLFTASSRVLSQMDIVQNRALRLITGGATSTPIAAMELQTEIKALSDSRLYAALSMGERILRKDPFWTAYSPAFDRLKTQKSFLTVFHAQISQMGTPSVRLPDIGPEVFPGFLTEPEAYIDLIKSVSKTLSTDMELRTFALATIQERYPVQDWLHIYTDGSATESEGIAGAGVYFSDCQLGEPLSPGSDNYDSEIHAIHMALMAISQRPETQVVLFIDSQAAIKSISEYALHPSTAEYECKYNIHQLLNAGRRIVLQWIPSHCGIFGNDRADFLAKEASKLTSNNTLIPLRNVKKLIRRLILDRSSSSYKVAAEGKTWSSLATRGRHLHFSLPRAMGVAFFRTLTGHDYLQAHLHRIGLSGSPMCVFCSSAPMTGEHLFVCPSLQDIRSSDSFRTLSNIGAISLLYWTARRLMFERTMVGVT